MKTLKAVISGQVQGLGFRPYVFRLATRMGVRGTVLNTRRGVIILAQGARAVTFLDRLRRHPPPLANIRAFRITSIKSRSYPDFSVAASRSGTKPGVDVLPDMAVCKDCIGELLNEADRRYEYAFTNCTQCGPRYSIVEHLPYDRPNTTMRAFVMCQRCRREYESPADRRFHAQPNCCRDCGPGLTALDGRGRPIPGDPVDLAATTVKRGGIVALKSIGGFQLVCDATNDAAVARLRRIKRRPSKPLALMCSDIGTARKICTVTRTSLRLLRSPAAPIVLMPRRAVRKSKVARWVAPANRHLGIMLPYSPLHHVLFRALTRHDATSTLVATSANAKDEPILDKETGLLRDLPGAIDLLLTHDRPIANPCDDSVVMDGAPPMIVRRARGYAPAPIELAGMFHVKRPVLAVGGDLKACFCLAAGGRAYLSPHIGDLGSKRAEDFFSGMLDRHREWTGTLPQGLACDLHPDYASTRIAEHLRRRLGIPLVRVQHHHAHAVAAKASEGVEEPMLGIVCDGTGYGVDGAIWGCEFILVLQDLSWRRLGHLGYLHAPGAGSEVPDPGLIAASYLAQSGLGHYERRLGLRRADPEICSGALTSSLGRLFDAVAAVVGVCRSATFEGEAPMALESLCSGTARGYAGLELTDLSVEPTVIRPEPLIRAVADDFLSGTAPGRVAGRFHASIAGAIAGTALALCERNHVGVVTMSGGSFQNHILSRLVAHRLRSGGVSVANSTVFPRNDAGLSLGQALVGARALVRLRHQVRP